MPWPVFLPLPLAPTGPPEDITADKWLQRLARQPLALPVAAAILASGFAWTPQTIIPPPETITVDKWLPLQTQPVRAYPPPRGAAGFTALAPDFVTLDRWLPTQTRPVRENPRPRGASGFTALAPDFVTADRWLPTQTRPANEPPRPRGATGFTALAPDFVTADRWLPQHTRPAPLARGPVSVTVVAPDLTFNHGWPVSASRPAYPVSGPRSASAWTAFVSAAEDVTVDKWLPTILNPIRVVYQPRTEAVWGPVVAAAPEDITPDKWLGPRSFPAFPTFPARPGVAEPPWDTSTPAVTPPAVTVVGGYPPFPTPEDRRKKKKKRDIVEQVAMAVAAEAPELTTPVVVARQIVRGNYQRFAVLDAETLAIIKARIADIEAKALAAQQALDEEDDIEILLLSG